MSIRLNYGSIVSVNSMEFNGVRPAWNIQFGLPGDLRLGRRELNLRPDSCLKQPSWKNTDPNKSQAGLSSGRLHVNTP